MRQWPIVHDPDCVRLEVVLQFLGHYENCVEQLLHLWVLCLSVLEDLTDKVHMLLVDFHRGSRPFYRDDSADYYIRGCHV
jgi:hypothetical protein